MPDQIADALPGKLLKAAQPFLALVRVPLSRNLDLPTLRPRGEVKTPANFYPGYFWVGRRHRQIEPASNRCFNVETPAQRNQRTPQKPLKQRLFSLGGLQPMTFELTANLVLRGRRRSIVLR